MRQQPAIFNRQQVVRGPEKNGTGNVDVRLMHIVQRGQIMEGILFGGFQQIKRRLMHAVMHKSVLPAVQRNQLCHYRWQKRPFNLRHGEIEDAAHGIQLTCAAQRGKLPQQMAGRQRQRGQMLQHAGRDVCRIVAIFDRLRVVGPAKWRVMGYKAVAQRLAKKIMRCKRVACGFFVNKLRQLCRLAAAGMKKPGQPVCYLFY